jgi:uncharacterized protein (TIGR02145 family)
MELKPTNERTMRFNLSLGICLSALVFCLPSCTDPCEDVVCLNGGACVDGDCACAEGWQGDDCSEPILQPPVLTGCEDLSSVTFDGHTYDLVQIGTQCWFKENLRSDNYRNGDPIPGNLTDAQWTSTNSGAQTVYGEGTSQVEDGGSDEVANLATYGRLYNGYAVNDARGLCPVGFHVPSDEDWMTLEMALGMTSEQASETNWRGTDQGSQLKASSNDSPPWNGSNSNGFSALPGGDRSGGNGAFFSLGHSGYWWSSSPSGSDAWYRELYSGYSSVYRGINYGGNGYSIRCVRDE